MEQLNLFGSEPDTWLDKKIHQTEEAFPQTFVNDYDEIILHKRENIYFRIDNIESELDFDCKILAYCSRQASKGVDKRTRAYFKNGLEYYFGFNFSQYELDLIYTYLGNDIRRDLCKQFITEDFNYKLLEARR